MVESLCFRGARNFRAETESPLTEVGFSKCPATSQMHVSVFGLYPQPMACAWVTGRPAFELSRQSVSAAEQTR